MKRTKHTRFICLALSAILAFGLTGCGNKSSENKIGVVTFDDIDKLADGGYYVQHEDVYYQPYFGQTSFTPGRVASAKDDKRVAWYGEDYANIPTMNKGDTIVYHSTQPFTEGITIERFEDLGYTVGICQMKETSSGRYSFATDSRKFNVDIKSDAGTLCQNGETTATFEKIGGVHLRAGNISRAGTIVGLSKDKTYDCDIYIGTDLHECKIKADVKALCSMEVFEIKDYNFDRSKTITFKFPKNLQSGYYNIGGFGIVRYINSTKGEFSESMDMNIPNDIENLYADADNPSIDDLEDYTEDIKEETFTLNEDADVTVSVIYQDSKDYTDAPIVKVVSSEAAYTLSKGKDNELTSSLSLKSGTYTIKLIGLGNRTYSYRVTKNEQKETKTKETEVQSGSGTGLNTKKSDSEKTTESSSDKKSSSGTSIADKIKEEEAKANGGQ